jgi:hypothetical protein
MSISKSELRGYAITAISIGLSFLLGGPLWGFTFLLVGIACLVIFKTDDPPPTSILEGVSERDYQELQAAVNRRRESELRLRDAERAQLVRILADQIDVIYREQQKGCPAPIIIPDQTWIELYKEHPADVIRDALRVRQSHNPIARVGRFGGRFRQ